jgi:hypothetical protein
MITFRLHYVDSKERFARNVAIRLRNNGLSLFCHLPQPATQLCRGLPSNYSIHNRKSRVVGRPRRLSCSRLCSCPLVVGTSDSVGCSARDRVGPGWVSRFVPYLGSEIKTPEPRSLTAEVAASTHMSGYATLPANRCPFSWCLG